MLLLTCTLGGVLLADSRRHLVWIVHVAGAVIEQLASWTSKELATSVVRKTSTHADAAWCTAEATAPGSALDISSLAHLFLVYILVPTLLTPVAVSSVACTVCSALESQ